MGGGLPLGGNQSRRHTCMTLGGGTSCLTPLFDTCLTAEFAINFLPLPPLSAACDSFGDRGLECTRAQHYMGAHAAKDRGLECTRAQHYMGASAAKERRHVKAVRSPVANPFFKFEVLPLLAPSKTSVGALLISFCGISLS